MSSVEYNMKVLFIKNLPKVLKNDEKVELLKTFGAHEIALIGQNCGRVSYLNENDAKIALNRLHQLDILGHKLCVTYGKNTHPHQIGETIGSSLNASTTDDSGSHKFNEFVKKLHAINSNLNFNQPPLPYLKYKYPKVSPDILQAICVALKMVPKFYTQVLHLMNRMNLPPPFWGPSNQYYKDCNFSSQFFDVQTQTEPWNKGKIDDLLASGESEMESEEEDKLTPIRHHKRKLIDNTQISNKKFRAILEAEKSKSQLGEITVSSTPILPSDVFEQGPSLKLSSRKITIQVPDQIEQKTTEEPLQESEKAVTLEDSHKTMIPQKFLSEEELTANRLTPEQLKILPAYNDYNQGTPSNKLYIKNLARTVTEEDLGKIFNRFIKYKPEEIDIRLMQSGRMKGQAFITFSTPYEKLEDTEVPIGQRQIDKALIETNGYILKDKPMIVMYAKNK